MNKTLILPTAIASVIGLAAVLLVLFAWHLPPFHAAQPTTENAYLRGKVTSLAPQLSGYLSEVDVVDFQTVKAGDVIARIDDRSFRQKLAQAEAALAAARAALQVKEQAVHSAGAVLHSNEAALVAAEAGLANARSQSVRARALKARGINSDSANEQAELVLQQADAAVLQARAQIDVQRENVNSARTQIDAAKAEIASAEAAVELARIDLSNTVIHAPADGHLGQVSARIGQYVTAGTALVSHVSSDLWIVANFKETSLKGMAAGQKVRFTVDAIGREVFSGTVESFSPAAASEFSLLSNTNATGNFTKIAQRMPVRIAIDPGQETAAMAPGLSVVVEVQTDPE
ncbi:HlyD family secretion protein [Paenirhodobacter sp.]|uniref:HlyD family secretion protein n=1 Tax=Paenirhodobacter sp. TaxID=1965326 RepID=UPI003B424AD9